MPAKLTGAVYAGLLLAMLALTGCQLNPPQPPIDPCSPMVNPVACENSLAGHAAVGVGLGGG